MGTYVDDLIASGKNSDGTPISSGINNSVNSREEAQKQAIEFARQQAKIQSDQKAADDRAKSFASDTNKYVKDPIDVFEDQFFGFNAYHPSRDDVKKIIPTSPWVSVQFKAANKMTDEDARKWLEDAEGARTGMKPDEDWVDISVVSAIDKYDPSGLDSAVDSQSYPLTSSMKFNNYVDSVSLEDSGGLVKCTLSIFDRTQQVENIVIKSLVNSMAKNKLINSATMPEGAEMKNLLQFAKDGTSDVQFRVRFGYNDQDPDKSAIDVDDFTQDFKDRTNNEKMVIRSPWINFKIMNLSFVPTPKGMGINVEGISLGENVLEKFKLVKRFYNIKGTPQNILTDLAAAIWVNSDKNIAFMSDTGKVMSAKNTDGSVVEDISVIPQQEDWASVYPETWPVDIDSYKDELSGASLFDDKGKETKVYINGVMTSAARTKLSKEGWDKYRISISLGPEPTFIRNENGAFMYTEGPNKFRKIAVEFMNLKQLLTEFCDKVPPRMMHKSNNDIKVTIENVKLILEGKDVTIDRQVYAASCFIPRKYTFAVKIINEKVAIKFFYQDVITSRKLKQTTVRCYKYNHPNSLIKNLAINTKTDFAMMNMSVVEIKSENGGGITTEAKVSGADSPNSVSIKGVNTTDFVKQLNTDGYAMASDIFLNKDVSDNPASRMIANINNGIFQGNLETVGDPYWLFDTSIQPFAYAIKILVPIAWNEFMAPGEVKYSYISGYYLIKKIKHVIDISGFKTELEVSRFPSTEQDLKSTQQ